MSDVDKNKLQKTCLRVNRSARKFRSECMLSKEKALTSKKKEVISVPKGSKYQKTSHELEQFKI